MNRQRAILAALLIILACSIVYSILQMPKMERIEKLTYQPGMTVKSVKSARSRDADVARVRLDLLERGGGTLPGGGRNIFRALYDISTKKTLIPLPPPPPPPPPVKILVPPPQVIEPTPLQREMATFTFLGFLKKDNKKTVFLSTGNEIFVVKKGDKILGKYDVSSVTEEALTIKSIQSGGEVVIPLVENRPLVAPRR